MRLPYVLSRYCTHHRQLLTNSSTQETLAFILLAYTHIKYSTYVRTYVPYVERNKCRVLYSQYCTVLHNNIVCLSFKKKNIVPIHTVDNPVLFLFDSIKILLKKNVRKKGQCPAACKCSTTVVVLYTTQLKIEVDRY